METRVRFETTRNSLLVLFTDYCTVLHTFDTFCRKFNLFTVNKFNSVLQLSIGKLCSSNSVLATGYASFVLKYKGHALGQNYLFANYYFSDQLILFPRARVPSQDIELWTPCRCLACIVRHSALVLYQVPLFMESCLHTSSQATISSLDFGLIFFLTCCEKV